MRYLRSARFNYAVSLFAAITAAAVMGGPIAYGIASALTVLAAAAAFLSWRCKRQLIIRHSIEDDICVRESVIGYSVHIRNNGAVPQTWAEISISSTRGIAEKRYELAMRPFGAEDDINGLCPPHRGIYTIMAEKAFVSDPFFLTALNARRPHPLTLTVLPKVPAISEEWKRRLDPRGSGGVFFQSSDEPSVDSRTYRYGDSQRRIHWNLTARRRELMVRQYESAENRRLTVLLDLTPFDSDDADKCEDALIESCLSVVRYALELRIETTLIYADGNRVCRYTGSDTRIFDGIRHSMAHVEFASDIKLPQLLDGAKQTQMLFLFCAKIPEDGLLSALPHEMPVELAVVRTRGEPMPLRRSAEALSITEIIP